MEGTDRGSSYGEGAAFVAVRRSYALPAVSMIEPLLAITRCCELPGKLVG